MSPLWTPSQLAAIELKGKTMLVSAAAGSGKTTVLTERIIRSLTDEAHPTDLSRILVVTFTRAAATDLKAKISKALNRALAEHPENGFLSKQLLSLGNAQISTIDSFFQRIVREHSDFFGISASFRIANDGEMYPIASETLGELIESYYHRYRVDIDNVPLDNIRANRFANCLNHLMSNRSDGKLDAALLEFYENFSSEIDGISVLKKNADDMRIAAQRDFFNSTYGTATREKVRERFARSLKTLYQLQDSVDDARCSALLSSDEDYILAVLNAIDKNCYERTRHVVNSFFAGRFPTVKNKSEAVLFYQEWRKKFKDEVQKKIQPLFAEPQEIIAQQLEQTAELAEMLESFYRDYEAALAAEKNKRSILEYNDVRRMLYRLLTESDGSPSAVADELAAQYDAVYIDEYQDVDDLQDRIFELIGREHRFMVGDIKQSIYGFRGSRPAIFSEYRKRMPLYTEDEAKNADGVCVFMSDNFRCDEPIIQFTNRVCAFLFSACPDSIGYVKEDNLKYSKFAFQANGPTKTQVPVTVAVFDAPPRTKEDEDAGPENAEEHEEAVYVAKEISRLLRTEQDIAPSDIAVLVRNKAQGAAYEAELTSLGIPVLGVTSDGILREPLLMDLLNLLRAVDNPYRDLPLSEFLQSPLGGFTLKELSALRVGVAPQLSLYEAMLQYCTAEQKEQPEFNGALCKKTQAMLQWLEKQQDAACLFAADRFLASLYSEPRLQEYCDSPVLTFVYEQARQYQNTAWCGLYGFIEQFSKQLDAGKLSAAGFLREEDAVRIMTIHHSKGLEFPVVFLCSCGTPFNKDDAKKSLMYHQSVGCASKLYNPDTAQHRDTALRSAVKLALLEEQTEESIRTLYVAFTRAKERLYVTGTLRGKWETALTAASLVQRNNRPSILGCNSFLAWLLASLYKKRDESKDVYRLLHFSYGKVKKGVHCSAESSETEERLPNAPAMSALTARLAQVAQRQNNKSPVQDTAVQLPSKLAASKLRPNLLDTLQQEEYDEDAVRLQLELMRAAQPSFERLILTAAQPDAAEIGSATHAFLQYCDFHLLAQNGIDEECGRLLQQHFLDAATVNIIHREQLCLFCQSELLQWVLTAKKVYREKKFGMLRPLATLTEQEERRQQLAGRTVFVQGSIDLLLETADGELLLIDYKTDRIDDAERKNPSLLCQNMTAKHGTQLSCYADAVEELFGRRPIGTYIYSLPLGKAIRILTETK